MFQQSKRKWISYVIAAVTAVQLAFPAQGPVLAEPVSLKSAEMPTFNEADIVPGKVIVKYKQNALKKVQSSSFSPSSFSVLSYDEPISVTAKLLELQSNPDVEYAEPVYKTQLIAATSSGDTVSKSVYSGPEEYMKQWGKQAADLDDMSAYSTEAQNQQVTVAVMDSGIDLTHPDLKSSIVKGYDFVNNDDIAQDDHGHGTHVSGIIAANSAAGTDYGIAPGVKIMPLKVLDSNGEGDTEQIVRALQYAIANKADVINMSLGTTGDSRAVRELIKQAYGQHIVLVAAAGNESNHWVRDEAGQMDPLNDTRRYITLTSYPAAYDEVISVGAVAQITGQSYAIADFSNVGKVDVVAPGVNIYSTALGGGYIYKSGTSQATPFVAGLSALLKAANKALDAEDIRTILQTSAQENRLSALKEKEYANLTQAPNDHVSRTMVYGEGMLQGIRAFETPRLKIEPVSINYPADRTVAFDATLLDVHNTVVKATYSVNLEARYYDETLLDREQDATFSVPSVSPLVEGRARLTAILDSSPLIHHVYVYGFWSADLSSGAATHRSNPYVLLKRPANPFVSLQSGTYEGEQTVTITTASPEGIILYRVQNADQTLSGSFNIQGGSLKIAKDTVLTVAFLQNNVFSEDAVYSYRITPKTTPPKTSGGGGGGTGGSTPSAPSIDANGKLSYEVTAPRVDVLLSLHSDSKEVTIDAATEVAVDILTVKVDADLIPKLWSKDKSLVIRSHDVTLSIPPKAFQVKDEGSTVVFKKSIDSAPSLTGYAAVSPIYDLSLTEKGNPVASFATPIQASFLYDSSKVKDPQSLGLYVLDEPSGSWTRVGGTLAGTNTITAPLAHFSKYAVLEKRPASDSKPGSSGSAATFADIQNHWAQKEIEQLIAQSIVDGVDADSFLPDASMTRAQFVTLLTKALQLKNQGSATTFHDVTNNSWYKDAVYAAYEANIVNGVSDKEFAPEASVTREQMAAMMVNAYLYKTGNKLSDIVITQEVKYSDEGTISEWARTQVRVASGLGLMNGTDGGAFAPSDQSTRAQAAVVLQRMLAKLQSQ